MSYEKQNFQSGDVLTAAALNAMDDQIDEVTNNVEEIKTSIDHDKSDFLASFMTNTVGPDNVITINDGAKNIPVKSMTVSMEPVQDKHGYDNPWVGGAGKNLLSGLEQGGINGNTGTDGEGTTTNRLRSIDPISVTVGQAYTISMQTASDKTLQLGVSFYPAIGEQRIVNSGWQTSPYAVQAPADATVMVILVRFSDDSDIVPSDVYNVQIELGTTATAYEPYENICPITGHTGVTVTRTGKNLLPIFAAKTQSGIVFTPNDDGSVTATGTATSNDIIYNQQITLPAGSYKVSGGISATCKIRVGYNGGTLITHNGGETPTLFTISEESLLTIGLRIQNLNEQSVNVVFEPMVYFAPGADDSYESYRGTQSIPINLQSVTGGTVYGGVLTVNEDGTGTVDITNGITVWDGTESLFKFGDTNCYSKNVNDGSVAGRTSAGWMSADELSQIELISNLVEINTDHTDTTVHASAYCGDSLVLQPCVFLPDCSTAADAQTWLAAQNTAGHPLTWCYLLKEPVSYTLTAEQLTTLLGYNTVFANAGEFTLTYRQDAELAVNGKISGEISGKADKRDTVLETTLSRGRKSGTDVGSGSFAFGNNVEASGPCSYAEGQNCSATAPYSHVQGFYCIANHQAQHVFGYMNIPDDSTNQPGLKGKYIEIVGNGQGRTEDDRSNARTLDWNGNEKIAGSITLGLGTSDEVTLTATQLKQLLEPISSAVVVDCGTITTLPVTLSVDGITSDYKPTSIELGTPTVMTSALTVNAGNGTITLSGTKGSGSTTCVATLVKAKTVTATGVS